MPQTPAAWPQLQEHWHQAPHGYGKDGAAYRGAITRRRLGVRALRPETFLHQKVAGYLMPCARANAEQAWARHGRAGSPIYAEPFGTFPRPTRSVPQSGGADGRPAGRRGVRQPHMPSKAPVRAVDPLYATESSRPRQASRILLRSSSTSLAAVASSFNSSIAVSTLSRRSSVTSGGRNGVPRRL